MSDINASISRVSILLLAVVFLHGCTFAGPNAIRSGRMAYNEAITETNDQQMLQVLVNNRYEESNHLLAVSSVTANVSVSTRAQVEAGFGSSDNYTGNLVPFRGGFIYEENPTISYTPVVGEAYLEQLMSPVPLPLLVQLLHSLPFPEYAYTMLLGSVNDIRNPAFHYAEQQDDPRFERFVATMTQLTHSHCLYWIRNSNESGMVSLAIEPNSAQSQSLAEDLLELLGITSPVTQGDRLVIPVSMALHGVDNDSVGMTTRTIWELVEILSAAVQVPAQDAASGAVSSYPQLGRAGRSIQIRFSEDRPEQAYVAIEDRGGWFYIDSRDQDTKRYFKLMGSLWSAAMARTLGANPRTPVLTVPVSR